MSDPLQHLRNCPWCGSAVRVLCDGHAFPDDDGKLVTCTAIVCNNDQCQAAGPFLASAEQATEAWNRVAAAMAERPALLAVAEAARVWRDAGDLCWDEEAAVIAALAKLYEVKHG